MSWGKSTHDEATGNIRNNKVSSRQDKYEKGKKEIVAPNVNSAEKGEEAGDRERKGGIKDVLEKEKR